WKIATNVCWTQRRRLAQRAEHESAQDVDTFGDVLRAPAQGRAMIDMDDLRSALQTMSPNQRQAILLREWQGLSYAEIGSELGLSQSGTETLLYRARRTLAQKLDELHATTVVNGLSFPSLLRT